MPSNGFAGAVVSIHAPARGATLAVPRFYALSYMFQSTPPREGRRHYLSGILS